MTILEILEAHRGTAGQFCAACPDYRPTQEELDAVQTIDDDRLLTLRHVAQVLEQHEREAKAEALEEAADEIERLENIGDTAQDELNEEQTAEYWLYYGTPKTTWLRDLAAQIRSRP